MGKGPGSGTILILVVKIVIDRSGTFLRFKDYSFTSLSLLYIGTSPSLDCVWFIGITPSLSVVFST